MAKNKQSKRKAPPIRKSIQEHLESEKMKQIDSAFESMHGGQSLSPTWVHSVGDRVNFSGYTTGNDYAEVIDVFLDNKVYYLRCVAFSKQHSEETLDTMSVHYVAAPWIKVRPLISPATSIEVEIKKQMESSLDFRQGNISTLLNLYYFQGVNMNPIYQRGLVWNEQDKESLIESIFLGANIGLFIFRDSNGKLDEPWNEIVDGKQRLSTIVDFFENRFRYRGYLYDELPLKIQSRFQEFRVSYAVANLSDEDVLRYFIVANRGGRRVDEEHINYVQQLLNDL